MEENVNGCQGGTGKVKALFFIKTTDCVFEDGVIVRLKKKYGKFQREIIKVQINDPKNSNQTKH